MAVAATFTYDESSSAAAVGHVVEFTFSVKNTGLLTLFEVHVHSAYLEGRESYITCVTDTASDSTVIGSSAGAVSGMMPYPDGGLLPGRSIECTASVGVLQKEVGVYLRALQIRRMRSVLKPFLCYGPLSVPHMRTLFFFSLGELVDGRCTCLEPQMKPWSAFLRRN